MFLSQLPGPSKEAHKILKPALTVKFKFSFQSVPRCQMTTESNCSIQIHLSHTPCVVRNWPVICKKFHVGALTWSQFYWPRSNEDNTHGHCSWVPLYRMEYYSAIKKNTFESVLMRWMKLEPLNNS